VFDAAAGYDVCDAAAYDGCDAAGANQVAILVVVVAAVGVDPAWLGDHAADRWDGVDQLGDVVAVASGLGHGQGMLVASVIGWSFEPDSRRSIGLGPMRSPFECTEMSGVNQGGGQVQQTGGAQFGAQAFVQLLPDAGLMPIS
jgi:hypothetical protein